MPHPQRSEFLAFACSLNDVAFKIVFCTNCSNGTSKSASLGAYSDQFSLSYSTSLSYSYHLCRKLMGKEAANEVIWVPVKQFITKKLKLTKKGYLTWKAQYVVRWGAASITLLTPWGWNSGWGLVGLQHFPRHLFPPKITKKWQK